MRCWTATRFHRNRPVLGDLAWGGFTWENMTNDERVNDSEEIEDEVGNNDLIDAVTCLITGETKLGVAQCDTCQCKWVAIYCVGKDEGLQCPKCFEMKGKLVEKYIVTKLNS